MPKIFLQAFAMFILTAIFYYVFLLSAVSDSSAMVNVFIDDGSGMKDIASLLKDKNLIRSELAFKIHSFSTGSAHILKPGNYNLTPDLRTPAIVRRLVNGPDPIKVLITEGMSLKDIENKLIALGLLQQGELINYEIQDIKDEYTFLESRKSLEGFLFPDTYQFFPDSNPRAIVKKFLDNFEKKALPFFEVDSEKFDYDFLIIASLIEREISISEDRRLVSGILWKRFKIGMPLQIDATVAYVKCGNKFEDCEPLTRSDFKVNSLYNTYYYRGLPPTPIANPGLDSIVAAFKPKKSEFLYYLSDPITKKTFFSRTLEEHNEKRARYLHL